MPFAAALGPRNQQLPPAMDPTFDDADAKPFQCPFAGCQRAFTELWKLRAHCRAPVRTAPGQGGHGEELQQCPKCLAALMPQLPHIGCTGGLAAPRQAAKRRRVALQRDEVKSSRRCTSAEPPSPEGPPLQLDRSISGPGMTLPHPATLLRPPQLEPSRLGGPAAASRSSQHVTLNPADLAAACLQAAADDPGAQSRVEAAAEAFLQMSQQQVAVPLETLVQTFITAVTGAHGSQSAPAGRPGASDSGSSAMLGSPHPRRPLSQFAQPAWGPEQGQSPASVAYGPLSPAVNGVASAEGSPPDGGEASHHSGGGYLPHLPMAGQPRLGQQGAMQMAGILPADDPRYRSSAMGTWLSDPPQHHHQYHHQQQHQQQQHPQQQDVWEGHHPAAGAPGLAGGLLLSEQEAWLQQQHLEAQVQAMHVQQQQVDARRQQLVPEVKQELQRAAGGSAEAALLHAGWAADGGGAQHLGGGGGRITPDLLASWPAALAHLPLDAAAGGAELALPPVTDGLPLPVAEPAPVQAPMQQPLANGIPQLRKTSVGAEDAQPHLPPRGEDGSRRFISLSDPTAAAPPQLPPKMPAPPPRPEAGAGQPSQQPAPAQPLNPFQAASLTNERFASPPPLAQPLQRGQPRPTLLQQGRRLSSQWSIGGRPLGSYDVGNPNDLASLTAALRAGSMRVNSLQAGSCTAEMMIALLGEGWLDTAEIGNLSPQPSASAPELSARDDE